MDKPDIASIPTSTEDLQEASKSLSSEELELFVTPTALSLLKHELMSWHDRLGQMGMQKFFVC